MNIFINGFYALDYCFYIIFHSIRALSSQDSHWIRRRYIEKLDQCKNILFLRSNTKVRDFFICFFFGFIKYFELLQNSLLLRKTFLVWEPKIKQLT